VESSSSNTTTTATATTGCVRNEEIATLGVGALGGKLYERIFGS
jgi:hypothetical protein